MAILYECWRWAYAGAGEPLHTYVRVNEEPATGLINATGYAPEQIEYGINRYQNETRRLYGVLDKHLSDAKTDYIVGSKCTIADIAHWGWVSAAGWAGIEINDFPNLKAWEDRMWAREGVKKGANVPDPYKM